MLWILPLLYAVWMAFHPAQYEARFDLFAPVTLENFSNAWNAAPFGRYFLNTFLLITTILISQFIVCTLAAYAFARYEFRGKTIVFMLVLVQLMIMPEVLLVENYRTIAKLGLVDTVVAMGLPYMASAFGIFLLRQTFLTVPKELDDAARVEGAGHSPRFVKSTCRWLNRSMWPTVSYRSAITGTTYSGRWSLPIPFPPAR
ncbi:hypothetical protein Q644_18495 [Brucella intermedia 229E]|uniref:ABC transmembrane type-1 domain-containing protein n=1 Tax=Brucella intermedia 229E TaxID=1337887 RepID=U4VAM6_9HYPH|nr:hypothetical protein Q644_18495 [Brucella intermedia 229E]